MKKMLDRRATGHRLANLMMDNGYTIAEFAEIMGVEPLTVCSWRKGEKMPKIDRLPAMADVLNVTVNELLIEKDGE